ncbi:helix-turn-helix domain-containing protein [Herbiconiux sp. CPCC 205763]|uniref:Helix-turn-helix domain-containing protein n=1 Tax=Herbiconiux aconitum TaxID=2970913 RepID=A0ABT2GZ80_9MICO|nr:AraC family transcriptional regulator [Herbiconiux aconitum]MCS5720271.1 helix-turn-helix domain-containing protein [Herbiconiux aconitum]
MSRASVAIEIDRLSLPLDGSAALGSIGADGNRIGLVVPVQSAVLVRTDDRTELVARPGGAVVLVGQARFAVAARGGGQALVLSSPRAPIESLVGASCSTGCLRDSIMLRAGTRFLIDVDRERESTAVPVRSIDRLLRELIVSVLVGAQEPEPAAPAWLGLFDRAVAHIAGQCTDGSLSTHTLARALNVSPRQLQRAFAANGSTPLREIRRHRAALAGSLLGNRAFAALNVDQISHQCGFRNAADMRRALASQELPSPRELRFAPPRAAAC